ncbi:Hypothetical_protein [Hexamita inflata]|uniref:Hypothetical_protein n=1 Tax=Hexamita inflata TaxID=28002 RepID=A0AA86NV83_9EUKA|nr:Hypothetical protein HINF_LOCUS14119 [Hexamita inflata]
MFVQVLFAPQYNQQHQFRCRISVQSSLELEGVSSFPGLDQQDERDGKRDAEAHGNRDNDNRVAFALGSSSLLKRVASTVLFCDNHYVVQLHNIYHHLFQIRAKQTFVNYLSAVQHFYESFTRIAEARELDDHPAGGQVRLEQAAEAVVQFLVLVGGGQKQDQHQSETNIYCSLFRYSPYITIIIKIINQIFIFLLILNSIHHMLCQLILLNIQNTAHLQYFILLNLATFSILLLLQFADVRYISNSKLFYFKQQFTTFDFHQQNGESNFSLTR